VPNKNKGLEQQCQQYVQGRFVLIDYLLQNDWSIRWQKAKGEFTAIQGFLCLKYRLDIDFL